MILSMGYFNRDNNDRGGRDSRGGGRSFGGGGRSSFGGGRSSGRRDDGPREMFKTVCSNCNKECEVPFRPTSGKPVYCSDCFEKMGGRNFDSARPERSDRPSFARSEAPRVNTDKTQLDAMNAKLDKIIKLLESKITPVTVEEVIAPPVVKAPKVKKEKVVKEVK